MIRAEEERKMQEYYPDDSTGKRIRWALESYKLDYAFPVAFGYSCVVLIFIAVEYRLMRTCDLLHKARDLPIRAKDLSGRGLDRYMTYLDKLVGVPRRDITHWPQMSALTRIRNCIVHTSGFIEKSRDEAALRTLIERRTYLTPTDKKRKENFGKDEQKSAPEIWLKAVPGGERLVIDSSYPLIASSYGREFFIDIFVGSGLIERRSDGSVVFGGSRWLTGQQSQSSGIPA